MALLDIRGMQCQQCSHVGCSTGTQAQASSPAYGLKKQSTRFVHSDDFIDNLEALINGKTQRNQDGSAQPIDQASVLVVDDN